MSHEKWAQLAGQMRQQEQPSARVVAGKLPRSHRPDGEAAVAAAERKMAEQEFEETSQRQCSCKGRTLLRLEGRSL